jgi:hypothetical protein
MAYFDLRPLFTGKELKLQPDRLAAENIIGSAGDPSNPACPAFHHPAGRI